jgi:hypothetical protein
MGIPLGQSDMFFRDSILTDTLPTTERGRRVRNVFYEEGYGRISGGTRVLELAADNLEGARARRSLAVASPVSFKSPWSRG